MSLINQMLKDLENRSKPSAQPEAVINGLQSISLKRKRTQKKYLLIVALLAFIAVWSWNFNYYYHARHLSASSVIPAPSVIPAKAGIASVRAQQIPASAGMTGSAGMTVPASPPAINPNLAAVTGLSMQVHGKMTFLRMVFDREVVYRVNSDPVMHSIMLHLKNTHMGVNVPPLDYAGSALANIKIYPEDKDGLNIILMLQADAKLSNLELNKESKFPELQADFLLENFAAKKETQQQAENTQTQNHGTLNKVALELTEDEQYQEALNFVESGEADKAILKLSLLLDRHPEYHAARESLVNLYMQQGNQAKAEKLLVVGLQKKPNDPAYIEVKAHILVGQGKIEQALNLLKKAPPALVTHPEYHAFLAALYQREGHLAAAESIYQQLTSSHPEKGVWWLGLGIAEDGLGKNSQALEAYTRADNSVDLDPELRGYVENKLRA